MENKNKMKNERTEDKKRSLRVLVGDDEIGVSGSLYQKAFLRNYEPLNHSFDFESNPERFVEQARVGNYDALLVDLDWKVEGDRGTTGLGVLHKVRNYAPVRLLHTSAELNLDLRAAAWVCEAGCIEKHRGLDYFDRCLRGSKESVEVPRE